MWLFIDESGSFTCSSRAADNPCCVGTLVIPEATLPSLAAEFSALRSAWPSSNGETKGHLLAESHVAAVVDLLIRHDILFEATVLDTGLHTAEDVTRHRLAQANRLTARLPPNCHPSLAAELSALRAELEEMPNQLYAQTVATMDVIWNAVQTATLYYSQRTPETLAAFRWVIDAKDTRVTRAERWWKTCVLPFLQSRSLREPFAQLEGADYSHFDRFCGTEPDTPRHLVDAIGAGAPFPFVDVRAIMTTHFRFAPSHTELGLQLADVLTNSLRRALIGHLTELGWSRLGQLIVQRAPQNIRVICLSDDVRQRHRASQYRGRLMRIASGGRRMIPTAVPSPDSAS